MFFTRSNLGFSLFAPRQGKGIGVAGRLARSSTIVRSTYQRADRRMIRFLDCPRKRDLLPEPRKTQLWFRFVEK